MEQFSSLLANATPYLVIYLTTRENGLGLSTIANRLISFASHQPQRMGKGEKLCLAIQFIFYLPSHWLTLEMLSLPWKLRECVK
jgi:hypothetical protein